MYPNQHPPIRENCLANFCFLSRADNKTLGGDAPSVYKKHLGANLNEIMASAFIDEARLFADSYGDFIDNRVSKLLAKAEELIN